MVVECSFVDEVVLLSMQIKKKIQEQMEQISDDIAEKVLQNPKLSDITQIIKEEVLRLGTILASTSLNHLVLKVSTESNIEGLKSKGKRERSLKTILGDIPYSRQAFYDSQNEKLCFPSDEAIGIQPGRLQSDVLSACVKLAIEVPFHEASSLYESLTGFSISEGAIYDATVEVGKCAELANVIPSQEDLAKSVDLFSTQNPGEAVHLVLSIDGAHEPLRPEESKRKGARGDYYWKECKGFRLFAVARRGQIAHLASWHQICDAHTFGDSLQAVVPFIKERKEECVVVADGAKWIWGQVGEQLPENRVEILDWYHAIEHLAEFADICFEKEKDKKNSWISKMKGYLMHDRLDSVVADIEQIAESKPKSNILKCNLIGYIKNNEKRMQYGAFSALGLTIGSGGMEAANKSICHNRLKKSGCWWKPSHANEMLRLRCAKANGTLDDIIKKCW